MILQPEEHHYAANTLATSIASSLGMPSFSSTLPLACCCYLDTIGQFKAYFSFNTKL